MKHMTRFFFLFILINFQNIFASEMPSGAILQAQIHAIPDTALDIKTGKIQPGAKIALQVEIKNIGNQPSAPGNLYVQFSLMEPMDDLLANRVFRTELISIPKIYPGQVEVLKFTKTHQWPSVFDYVKQSWNMRHYQAIFKQDNAKKELVIGTLPLLFSAYYYEGPRQQIPQQVLPAP